VPPPAAAADDDLADPPEEDDAPAVATDVVVGVVAGVVVVVVEDDVVGVITGKLTAPDRLPAIVVPAMFGAVAVVWAAAAASVTSGKKRIGTM
jgi:hypothetical protein